MLPDYKRLCTLEAWFQDMRPALKMAEGSNGIYWYMDLEVLVYFDGNQLQGKL
jgi:hypothetical protein